MRIEAAAQRDTAVVSGWLAAAEASQQQGTVTVDATLRLPVSESLLAGVTAEAPHVDGGLAEHSVRFAWLDSLELMAPAAGLLRFPAMTLPENRTEPAETLQGAAAGAAVIPVPEAAEKIAALDSLAASIATPPSPRGFLDLAWLTSRTAPDRATPLLLEASHVAWTAPESVEGAAFPAIGPATVMLSNWPV